MSSAAEALESAHIVLWLDCETFHGLQPKKSFAPQVFLHPVSMSGGLRVGEETVERIIRAGCPNISTEKGECYGVAGIMLLVGMGKIQALLYLPLQWRGNKEPLNITS